MKVRAMHDIEPIQIAAGDSIELTYIEDRTRFGGWGGDTKKTLLTETFNEARTIDRVAIVELEGGELAALGMRQGIAGVFGEKL